jgi:hypothetical protein
MQVFPRVMHDTSKKSMVWTIAMIFKGMLVFVNTLGVYDPGGENMVCVPDPLPALDVPTEDG